MVSSLFPPRFVDSAAGPAMAHGVHAPLTFQALMQYGRRGSVTGSVTQPVTGNGSARKGSSNSRAHPYQPPLTRASSSSSSRASSSKSLSRDQPYQQPADIAKVCKVSARDRDVGQKTVENQEKPIHWHTHTHRHTHTQARAHVDALSPLVEDDASLSVGPGDPFRARPVP